MAFKDSRSEKRFQDQREKKERIKAGLPGEDEQPLPPPVEPIHSDKGKTEIGRNDPCPCGSGKKYKKCCGK